jgi:hypothetical protein
MLFVLPLAALPSVHGMEELGGRRWRRRWRMAGVGLVLGVSVWMQWVVNRSDVWFFYEIQHPLDGRMDRDIAEYLFDRPEAVLIGDLERGRDDLDDTQLFKLIRRDNRLTDEQMVMYRKMVMDAVDTTNLYWWPPAHGKAPRRADPFTPAPG